ncbi:DNA-3-methyladenine glycosylase 2 family protein [Flaviaesturariibacter amylovorans]|uniref:DNA-3-methyladenine glycosylase II n=1 Tax=Flaviaesturariibacter amylovorans TaxID=1084520 RepID=A0ABP8HPR7_9BACT
MNSFNAENFHQLCDAVAERDADLKTVIDTHGYPPLWTRPNRFATLVLTILEQQVSLQSAYAAFKRLEEKIGLPTPVKLLALTDEELRACSFTRQKMAYVRGLAEALQKRTIVLKDMEALPDDEVRRRLTALKGIGDWTVDIYLLHSLGRTDLFPTGDLALMNGIKMVKGWDTISKERALEWAAPLRPWRSIATMIVWHHYIRKRNIRIVH